MDEKNRRNILILDPERDTAEFFTRALETRSNSFKCYWVKTPEEAKSLLSEIHFNFLLADICVLRDDHFLLLNEIREMCCRTVVIVDAYLNEKESVRKAMELGAKGYFIKPVMVNSLRKIIDDLALPDEA
ncbi:MAG: response regulator [Syntrophobacteraceae bacterium]